MLDNASNNRRIAKNSIFLSIRMVVVLVIAFYTTRVLLRILGVEDYGTYNVVCGFVSMFSFLNTSMSNGIQRFYNYEYGKNGEEGANKVYCTAVLIQLILSFILIILTESIGLYYLHNKMVIPDGRMFAAEWIFQFSILSMVLVIVQAPFTAAVMAHERMDFYAVVNVLDALLKLGIVFLLPILHEDQLIWYGILMAGINIFNFFIYYLYCKRNFKEIRLHQYFDNKQFVYMLSFSGWNIFGSFSGVMKEQGINLVLNLFYGPIVNAARGVAAQVNSGLQGFVANITVPVRPQVIQSYAQGNLQRTIGLTYSISKLSCGLLYTMALPIFYEIDFILLIWLGDNIPDHSNTFVIIILITSFLNNLNSAVSGVVHATGRMKLYQLSTSLSAISAVPLAYFALRFGMAPEWALVMVTITMIFAQAIALIVLKHLVGISIVAYCKSVLTPLLWVILLTIWIPIVPRLIIGEGWIRLCISVCISSIAVLVAFYFVGLQKNEKDMVNEMITKCLQKTKLFL